MEIYTCPGSVVTLNTLWHLARLNLVFRCYQNYAFYFLFHNTWHETYRENVILGSINWHVVYTGRSRFMRFLFVQFASTELENSPHFFNFRFDVIWYRWSVAALIFCRRLAESDVTVTPLLICMNWLCWYNYMAPVVSSSTALAFLANMSEKHKSTSPSAIQVKKQWKTIGTDWKLDVISQHEKGEWIVGICRSVKTD